MKPNTDGTPTRRKLPIGIQTFGKMRERGYADKYRARGEPIHLVGVEFSEARRNLVGMETAEA